MKNQIIDSLVSAQTELKALSSLDRYSALTNIANEILHQTDRLTQLIITETSKPHKYAKGEVLRAANTFQIAAEEAKRLPRESISLDWAPNGIGKEGTVKWFPIGPILGITPFNFPLNLVAHKIAPALAAGCPILIKPSPKTPKTAAALVEICKKSGVPSDAIQLLEVPNEEVIHLVEDDRFKMLSFTGSPEIGWMLKARAKKKKVALELGGNAGAIVAPSANIELAAKRCTIGGFAFSGQVCIHTQRIYVHQSILEKFKSAFLTEVDKITIGDPFNKETAFSEMISEEAAIRTENWIKEAQDQGAQVLAGGTRNGKLIPPTVLTNTSPNMLVCKEEVFGPVVILEGYSTIQGVIDTINDSRFGLQAGLFTDSNAEIKKAFDQLEVGGLIVNDVPTFRVDHMPYGGIKDSGFGREGVKYAIREMMEPKLLVN